MYRTMIIIGEKISVIAKKVREALGKYDPKPLQELAVAQAKAGAHYIDVSIAHGLGRQGRARGCAEAPLP